MQVTEERDSELSVLRSSLRAHMRAAAPSPSAVEALVRFLTNVVSGSPERWARWLLELVEIYGTRPFTSLSQAQKEVGVDRETMLRLLDLFGRVPELRDAVQDGPAGKYWSKTILPFEEKGIFDAVLEGKPSYPQIVGLYPGPSCMFRCHFCVRVTGAKYPKVSLETGNDRLFALIDEAPTDNPYLLYLSGGLEPLTNPRIGEIVDRAARRGFLLTMYSNSFALTEQNLQRQPGLWSLAAIRTSLYGLSDEEYEATTQMPRAFQRVTRNLKSVLVERQRNERPIKLGLNYLILPGRAHRLLALADYIHELSENTPLRPLDFLDLRQDYSGRADGQLSGDDAAELQEALGTFEEKIQRTLPHLKVDYGYSVNALRNGKRVEMLRVDEKEMRPLAHPQVAVQVDLLGDVYLYREAGFPELPGANRYIAGRVESGRGLQQVVKNFLETGKRILAQDGDRYFLDGFDQVVTTRLNQLEVDLADGWGSARGFLR